VEASRRDPQKVGILLRNQGRRTATGPERGRKKPVCDQISRMTSAGLDEESRLKSQSDRATPALTNDWMLASALS
jgi:hypothetical protein